MTALDPKMADYEGVNCDTCHRMVDPFSVLGQLPWVPEETVPAAIDAQDLTENRDWTSVLQHITAFDGSNYFDTTDRLPVPYGDGSWPHYTEAAAGQFYMDPNTDKRGPRYNANPRRHIVYYSRFHKSKTLCSTCHDVSNPALANVLIAGGIPEEQAAGSYFHVERTWSEFQLGPFSVEGGAPTDAVYAERTGITRAAMCQDCHMPDSIGKAATGNVSTRTDLATHKLSGGNTWITRILATADATSPAYDAYNFAILSGAKYPGARIETGVLQGHGAALLDGEARARANLRNAAHLEVVHDHSNSATVRIRNLTGHKLISGFPEGRRMWLQVEFMDASGGTIGTLNSYDPLVTSLDGDGNRQYESGGILNEDREDLVFEAKMSSSLTGEEPFTFHFVLADDRYKDNRIPPRGFNAALAAVRLVQPRWEGADAPDYFTEAEYAGGYDEVSFDKPAGTAGWRARLFYQTTSKEYIEFLRDEANGTASTLSSPTPSGEPTAYIIQTDPYFSTLKDWGRAIYDLWLNTGGSPPELMTETVSLPSIREMLMASTQATLRFHTMPGRRYQVQYSDDMTEGSWTDLGEEVSGDGTVHEYVDTDPMAAGRRFYRIESEEP